MRKYASLLIAAIFIFMAAIQQNVLAQQLNPSATEINHLKDQILRANGISEHDYVFPGQRILIPFQGTNYEYVVEPWTRTSEKGCAWQVAQTFLQGNLQTVPPMDSLTKRVEANTQSADFPYWLPIVIFAILLILVLLGHRERLSQYIADYKSRRLDPLRGRPALAGGITSPERASAEITEVRSQFMNDRGTITRTTPGILIRVDGKNEFITKVRTYSYWQNAQIPSGIHCYRAEIRRPNGSMVSEYYLSQCCNQIGGREVRIPEGWEFRAEQTSVQVDDSLHLNQPETDSEKSIHNLTLKITVGEKDFQITGNARYPKSIKVEKDGKYEVTF